MGLHEEDHESKSTSIDGTGDQEQNRDSSVEKHVGDEDQDLNSSKPEDHASASTEDRLPLAKLLLIGLGLWSAVFLYSLDQTIVADAIPSITDEFEETSDIGWYGSAYLLTVAAFQLLYGRVYSNFSLKFTFLAAISIFELGSLVCALAPTSTALIIGRAVAGIGGSGISSGAFIIIAHSFPTRIRPLCIASIVMIYGVAAVLGPVLGGIFTSELTWRWCFWINLPFGGVTIAVILFFFPDPARPQITSVPVAARLKKLDIVGLLIFVPAVVCLLLALQWGGEMYPWSNGRIIALLVLFGVLTAAFLAYERCQGAEASFPIHIAARRSIAAAFFNGFCNVAGFILLIYYMPFWQQVVRGVSAKEAGIDLLPYVLGFVIMANLSAALVSKFGYYAPMMILSSIITPIGVGLITTWTINTPSSQWIGYQALAGIGLGLGQQQPMVAIQTLLSKSDIPSGASMHMLMQTLSGAIFVSIGQALLQNKFAENLQTSSISNDVDTSALVKLGATQLRAATPPQDLQAVLVAYNGALMQVFTVALVMSSLTIIGSVTIEWKSVRKAN